MKLTFSNARVWRYAMAAIGKFIESGVMIVNNDGLLFKAMDPSRVALIEFQIPKESFEEFQLDNEINVTVNVEDLSKILRSSEKDDKISLEISENSLSILLERRGIPRAFVLPLQTSSETELIPELRLDLRNRFRVSGITLYEGIGSIEDIGDVLTFSVNEGELKLRVSSDLGEAEVAFSTSLGNLIEYEVNEPAIEVSYGLDYVVYVKPVLRIAEVVDILLSSEMPCKLVMDLPHGAKMNYYVAPRID